MDNKLYKFCPRCGSITKNMICDNCGYTLDEEEINNDVVENNEEPYEIKDIKPRKNLWWVFALIAAGVVAIPVVLIVLLLLITIAGLFLLIPTGYLVSQPQQTMGSQTQQPPAVTVIPYTPSLPVEPLTPDGEGEGDNEFGAESNEAYDPNQEGNTIDYIVSSGFNVTDYDFDEMKEYLSSANENTDVESDVKNDYFFSDYYVNSSGKQHKKVTQEDFDEPYFTDYVDYFDDTVDYEVERRYVRVEGEKNGVFYNLYGAYYVVSSDKTDFTAVNEELKKRTYNELYRIIKNDFYNTIQPDFTCYADSYITFNSDELLSVVYDCYCYEGTYMKEVYASSVNIDIANAVVLDNSKLINTDDAFVDYFIERSTIQNGYLDVLYLNNKEDILKIFEDPEGLILFFTPVGLEVGINYAYNGSYGWVTISVNDFGGYMSDEFTYDTEYAKSFNQVEYENENNIVNANGDMDSEDL